VVVRFLDTDAIVEMHEVLLERWGGHPGGGHRGSAYEGAEAAVQAVKNSYYTEIADHASSYAVYIVQGHVFMDGNKRTGAAALTVFLEANGARSTISPMDLMNAMVELQARSERGESTDVLITWLAAQL